MLFVQYLGIYFCQYFFLVYELIFFDQNGVDMFGDFIGNINFGGFDLVVVVGKFCWEFWWVQQLLCGGGEYYQ